MSYVAENNFDCIKRSSLRISFKINLVFVPCWVFNKLVFDSNYLSLEILYFNQEMMTPWVIFANIFISDHSGTKPFVFQVPLLWSPKFWSHQKWLELLNTKILTLSGMKQKVYQQPLQKRGLSLSDKQHQNRGWKIRCSGSVFLVIGQKLDRICTNNHWVWYSYYFGIWVSRIRIMPVNMAKLKIQGKLN